MTEVMSEISWQFFSETDTCSPPIQGFRVSGYRWDREIFENLSVNSVILAVISYLTGYVRADFPNEKNN